MMKRIAFILLPLLFVLAGCSKEITTTDLGSYDCPGNGGNVVFGYLNESEWTSSSDASWLTVAPSWGYGKTKVTVKVEPNPGERRSATVSFTAGSFVDRVTIVQGKADEVTPPGPGQEEDPGTQPGLNYTLRQHRSPKRGGAQSFASLPESDIPLIGPYMSWSYNWSSNPLPANLDNLFAEYKMDWCPMVWNANYNADNIRNFKRSHPEAEYILGFNEPNLKDQANMTPAQAAKSWPAVVSLAKELGMKVVSPAMNYGTLEGYSDPIVWLDEFFSLVSLDDIAAIAVHTYMPSASSVKDFIAKFAKYGKPIWLTEFCNGNNNNISEAVQTKYLCETLNMLEQNDAVERYAWFQPRGSFNNQWHNNLLTTTLPIAFTPLGKIFANISTFDDSIVYEKEEVIPAEQYRYAAGTFHLAPSTDGGVLDVTDFNKGCETRYRLNIPQAGTFNVEIRYQTYMESSLSLIAGGKTSSVTLRNTSKQWVTGNFELELPAGENDLIVRGESAGAVSINWLRIK